MGSIIFKCKMCGGSLNVVEGNTIATCEFCGTKQTLPRLDSEKKASLFDRANHFRRNNEYDKASFIFEEILAEEKTDAEVYWALVLCRYGIEYVEDPLTHNRIPTINRMQYDSILKDQDYLKALELADLNQKELYIAEANKIDEIQKGILEVSNKEEPFDIFICYKETDENGRRTEDSVLAQDIYKELTNEGYKVFFSRITLEDKIGSAYEPYIFAALNSARVMLAIGTKIEHFNAVWVKNEWSRYLALIKKGQKKTLVPCYKNMDPYDLPEEFAYLQAQDMSKLGYLQDLTRGIEKIIGKTSNKQSEIDNKSIHSNTNNEKDVEINNLIKMAFISLEDSNYSSANEYVDRVLIKNPENSNAYLIRLLCNLKVNKIDDLATTDKEYEENANYKRCLKFSDEKQRKELEKLTLLHNNKSLVEHFNLIIDDAKNKRDYQNLLNELNNYETDSSQKEIIESFKTKVQELIKDDENRREQELTQLFNESSSINEYESIISVANEYKDLVWAKDIFSKCNIKIDEIENNVLNTLIDRFNKANTKEEYENIYKELKNLKSNEETEKYISNCQEKVKVIEYNEIESNFNVKKTSIIKERIKQLERFGDYRNSKTFIKKYKDKLKFKKIRNAIIIIIIIILSVIASINIDKENKYNKALSLMKNKQYQEAYSVFNSLNDYKDSYNNVLESQYLYAIELYEDKQYQEAYTIFYSLNEYKNSAEMKVKSEIETFNLAIQNDTDEMVHFGLCEQDNILDNGKEPIEWIVIGEKDNKVLLLSKYALDTRRFDDNSNDYETSEIHDWLNNKFYNEAFTDEEKAQIEEITLLTTGQVNKLDESIRMCKATEYAISNGCYVVDNGNCCWWLSSPGGDSNHATRVDFDGHVNVYGSLVNNYFAVRSVLLVNLES